MTATELLDRVHAVGAEVVYLGGGELWLRDPKRAVTSDLRATLIQHRAELLDVLRPHPCIVCGKLAFPVAGVTCYWCRRAP